MGKVFRGIDADLAQWIAVQPMFFVASAPLAAEGLVNVSPRGQDCFSVLGELQVGWVDFTGSGVETIAHLRQNGRITLMWCAFSGPPRIVRLHGTGTVHLPGAPRYDEVVARHPSHPSTRAVVTVDVNRISDSCGYGVPLMDHVGERDQMLRWAQAKGPEAVLAYQAERNAASLDGLPGLT